MKKDQRLWMIGLSLVMLVLSQFMAVTYACKGSFPLVSQAVHSLDMKAMSSCPEMSNPTTHQPPAPFCLAHCQLFSQHDQTSYPSTLSLPQLIVLFDLPRSTPMNCLPPRLSADLDGHLDWGATSPPLRVQYRVFRV